MKEEVDIFLKSVLKNGRIRRSLTKDLWRKFREDHSDIWSEVEGRVWKFDSCEIKFPKIYELDSDSEADIVKWIIDNLSTSRKFIGANFSRDNWKFLKTYYPKSWRIIKGKSIFYGETEYTFVDIDYADYSILGKKFKFNRNYSERVFNIFHKNEYESVDDVIDSIFHSNISGFDLLSFIKSNFRDFFEENLEEYSEKSRYNREAIWMYKNKIKDIPEINGIKLPFHTSYYGYSYYDFWDILKQKNCLYWSEDKNLDICRILINDVRCGTIMKKFYSSNMIPHLEKRFFDIKDYSEMVYRICNNLDDSPKCFWCKENKCSFKTKTLGYFDFCSRGCARDYLYSEHDFSGPKIDGFDEYKTKCYRYTNWVYQNNENVINPERLIRSVHDYHVDHIVPIKICFESGFTIEEACDIKNLRMLHCKDNLNRKNNITDRDDVMKILEEIRNYER